MDPNTLSAAEAVREYIRLKGAANDARRAYIHVDMRRKSAHGQKRDAISAWIAAEAALEAFVVALGFNRDTDSF